LQALCEKQEISQQTLTLLRKYPQNSKLVDNHGFKD